MSETRRLPSGGGAPNEAERPYFKRGKSASFSLRDDTSDKIVKLFISFLFFFKVRQKVLVRSACCTSAVEGIRACPWIYFFGWVGGGDMVF